MKTIDKDCFDPIFQGDVMIMRVREVPNDVKKLPDNIIAHSETGHNHIAVGADVLGGMDPMTMFLKAGGNGFIDIVHQREFDTHETYRLLADPGEMFIIKRQREYTPQGWRRVDD